MSQQIGKVTVRTPGSSSDRKVQSIQYGVRLADKKIANFDDVVISENMDNAVMTYDSNTKIFTVQTLPEIDGGYF